MKINLDKVTESALIELGKSHKFSAARYAYEVLKAHVSYMKEQQNTRANESTESE
ncbi:hypothetical protein [Nitrincola alkalilacustris]|uniref:hypothetical protein n=1 Tax=Nitrincola alkalilacustris TaxID=1571224 RepID=UPI0014573410|nr:hypothetical protein [Nitrincola alkalilacustris]